MVSKVRIGNGKWNTTQIVLIDEKKFNSFFPYRRLSGSRGILHMFQKEIVIYKHLSLNLLPCRSERRTKQGPMEVMYRTLNCHYIYILHKPSVNKRYIPTLVTQFLAAFFILKHVEAP